MAQDASENAPGHVVVGLGINAPVAAALLALKGARVAMLEREARLGGCLLTNEVTRPGFRHDVMPATWVLFATGPASGALGPDLARHGFAPCNGDRPTGTSRLDGRALVLIRDRAANVAAFNADRIEAIPARHARGLAGIKLARRAHSPADLERLNANLVGGGPHGGDRSIDQFFPWRPFARSKGHRTGITGLLRVGASTHPGPGLGGGSGFLAAKALGA